MKKIVRSCGLALAIASLSATALYGQSEAGNYSQTSLGRTSQPAPRAQREGSVYRVEDYGLQQTRLAPGKARGEVEAYCNTCHSLMYITMQPPLPAAAWEANVMKMVETFGQPIPKEAIPRIIAYLQEHYTPETRGRVAAASRPEQASKAGAPKKSGGASKPPQNP